MNTTHFARQFAILTISALLVPPALTRASDPAPATQPAAEAVSDETLPATVDAGEATAVLIENESTALSLDRSGWPIIRISPADGTVTHNPHFMGDPPMGEDMVSPLHAPDPVWQIQEALAGARAGNLNGENLAALGAQPIIGLAQFIAMPVRMILANPLSEATSP
jgi:hypothetical protein